MFEYSALFLYTAMLACLVQRQILPRRNMLQPARHQLAPATTPEESTQLQGWPSRVIGIAFFLSLNLRDARLGAKACGRRPPLMLPVSSSTPDYHDVIRGLTLSYTRQASLEHACLIRSPSPIRRGNCTSRPTGSVHSLLLVDPFPSNASHAEALMPWSALLGVIQPHG